MKLFKSKKLFNKAIIWDIQKTLPKPKLPNKVFFKKIMPSERGH